MIINPNSCGQGFDKDHLLNDYGLYSVLIGMGYEYSHSTPIVHKPTFFGTHRVNLHTFKFPGTDHSVSYSNLPPEDAGKWRSQVSNSSSVQIVGHGTLALTRHLKSKAKRYGLRHKGDK